MIWNLYNSRNVEERRPGLVSRGLSPQVRADEGAVVEDDSETAAYIIKGLSEHGHVVDHADSGWSGLILAGRGDYEVAIVDRMLPGLDGLSLVKDLRGNGIGTPVLFLTNLCGIDDRVEGLDGGGDDLSDQAFCVRPPRDSIVTFWPSTKPVSFKPCRNAATISAASSGDLLLI